jgi:hypothetical protein
MKRILILTVIIIACFGCARKKSFNIVGNIPQKTSGYVHVYRTELNIPILIDSAKINKSGSFKIKVKALLPEFYQVALDAENFITLLATPGEKINLMFSDTLLFDNYIVEGSEESEKIRYIDQSLIDTKKRLDSLTTAYEKASFEPNFETIGAELESMYSEVVRLQRRTNIEFVINNLSSLASIKAIYQRLNDETYVLYEPRDIHYMKLASDSLSKYHPNSKHVQALIRDFDNELARFNANQIAAMAEQIESIELNPALQNTEGRTIALQSLRGRYVLMTFWSVHSQTSVQENIELKQFYSRYNRRGFEIYQINLDADEELWKNAVKFEELPWISVREDDPANPVIAQFFNVRELPSNCIFDKQGNIIGRNLHGRTLRIKLEQLFDN